MVEKETNAESWMLSKKPHKMNALWDYISHKTVVSKVLDAGFNFPEIHLMSHWVTQIHQYRALPQYPSRVTNKHMKHSVRSIRTPSI
jgi:hypothetical protein